MRTDIDPAVVAAFGSETRVRTLAVLANAHGPLTAYRIGLVGDVPFPKVYRELYRLEKAGVVGREGKAWTLLDSALASYLSRRVRIAWDVDMAREVADAEPRNARRRAEALRQAAHVPPPSGFVPRHPEEFRRSPLKDRRLREMGLPTSVHADE